MSDATHPAKQALDMVQDIIRARGNHLIKSRDEATVMLAQIGEIEDQLSNIIADLNAALEGNNGMWIHIPNLSQEVVEAAIKRVVRLRTFGQEEGSKLLNIILSNTKDVFFPGIPDAFWTRERLVEFNAIFEERMAKPGPPPARPTRDKDDRPPQPDRRHGSDEGPVMLPTVPNPLIMDPEF
jgi:hypothetical protein